MLENKLKIHMAIYDSAPCHHLKLVSDFPQKKNQSVGLPGNSPYFNLIENFWAILKDTVADEHPQVLKT